MKIKLLGLFLLGAVLLGCDGTSPPSGNTNATNFPGSAELSGTAQAGETLTLSVSDANGITFNASSGNSITSVVWSAGGALIAGATGEQYTLTAMEVGSEITALVEYVDNGGFTEIITTAPTATVVAGDTGGGGSSSAAVIDDSFADGDRTSTGALDADWWSSNSTSGNSVEIAAGALGLVSGTSGRGIHATFAPQTLAEGDSITVTYSFTTPTTIGTAKSTAFKVALMDFNNMGLAADLLSESSSANPLYQGQPGYFTAFDVDQTGLGSQDTDIRKHDVAAADGRFLGTTDEWASISSSADAGYAFQPNTDYVGVFTITRTGADSVEIFSSLSLDGGAMLDSHTAVDGSSIANNFGMLGFWVNSNTFGSTNAASDPDNGITFTNVLIEVN